MPLPTINDINDTNQIRIRQLSISIEALRFFYKKKNFPNIDSILKQLKAILYYITLGFNIVSNKKTPQIEAL
jgi:hypothetical protein